MNEWLWDTAIGRVVKNRRINWDEREIGSVTSTSVADGELFIQIEIAGQITVGAFDDHPQVMLDAYEEKDSYDMYVGWPVYSRGDILNMDSKKIELWYGKILYDPDV